MMVAYAATGAGVPSPPTGGVSLQVLTSCGEGGPPPPGGRGNPSHGVPSLAISMNPDRDISLPPFYGMKIAPRGAIHWRIDAIYGTKGGTP
jgi:hypothetical protein